MMKEIAPSSLPNHLPRKPRFSLALSIDGDAPACYAGLAQFDPESASQIQKVSASVRNGPYTLVVAPPGYPGMRYRGRYCYEHHVVWWQSGRELPSEDEILHHANGIKTDNRIDNLQMMTKADHCREHHHRHHNNDPNTVCGECGTAFRVRPCKLKREKVFCSRRCSGLFSQRKRTHERVIAR